ncbi:galacturonosyltransferase 14 [Pyrus ussuriensis x Pyrus communis]|uniref:Galacturonosyltransferase 14 n=1 Tax=Pyrus ussuriensis x Pyrus communis TaxID=2448454 RepID=A0A5N5H8C5_9ROSA|nr:galacturonosyltransferase 14 [Pyrus ussuriensis x Pyrus communis]
MTTQQPRLSSSSPRRHPRLRELKHPYHPSSFLLDDITVVATTNTPSSLPVQADLSWTTSNLIVGGDLELGVVGLDLMVRWAWAETALSGGGSGGAIEWWFGRRRP